MALPSGNDEQIILWRLVVETKEAQDDIEVFLQQVQSLKDYLVQLNKEQGTAFDSISRSLKRSLKEAVDSAKADLKRLKAGLEELQAENTKISIGKSTLDPEERAAIPQNIAQQNAEIKATEKRLAEATESWNIYNAVAARALQEVKQEAQLAQKGFEGLAQTVVTSGQQTQDSFAQTVTNTKAFGTSVEELKAKLTAIKSVSSESFDQIAKSLGTELADNAKIAADQVANLEQQIKDLQSIQAQQTAPSEITTSKIDTAGLERLQSQLDIAKQRSIEAEKQLLEFANIVNPALQQLGTTANISAKDITILSEVSQQLTSSLGTAFQQPGTNIQEFGSQIDILKQKLVNISEQSGQSLQQAAQSIGVKLVDNIKKANDEISVLETQLGKLQSISTTKAVETVAPQVDVEGLKELQSQLDVAKQKSDEAEKKLLEFTSNINPALQELGVTATTSAQGVATLSGISQQLATSINTAFQQPNASIRDFGTLVDTLKQKIVEISQQTGQSFKVVGDSIKQAFQVQGKQALDAIRVQIAQTKAEIAAVQKVLLNPPANFTDVQTQQFNQQLSQLQQRLGVLTQQLANTQQQVNQFGKATTTASSQLTSASAGVNTFTKALTNLNSIARIVFGVTLLGLASQALRSLIGWLQDTGNAAFDFARAMFQLEVGVRALRRVGVDITSSDILENLQKINAATGNLFSQLELVQGAADFSNLIRDLGLTREEIFKLQDAVVKLAIINGRSLADVQRTVALALSSGYTEGLQRLGVSINRLTIAEEANRLGFKGGYTALSEQARSQATYNLLIQKTTKYSDDLSEAQNRLFGAIQNVRAETENIRVEMGENWLPVQLQINKAVLFFLKLLNFSPIIIFTQNISKLSLVIKSVPAIFENAGKGADTFAKKIEGVKNLFQDLVDVVTNKKPFEDWIAELAGLPTFGESEIDLGAPEFDAQTERLRSILEQYGSDVENLEQEIADKRKAIEEDLQADLVKIEEDGAQDRLDIARDFDRDIEKINQDGANRLIELGRKLQERLNSINIKLNFDLGEAKIRFDFDVNETFIKYNQEVAKANEDFRLKELKRERDYQEKLKQLREDYLLSLEDALEQRDARAVLRARREYNLEKERAVRANEINQQENKEALQQDLETAKQRREQRLRELRIEFQMRQEELKRNAEYDRQQALRNYAQDVQDLQASLEQQRQERALKFKQQLADQAAEELQKRERRIQEYVNDIADLQEYEQKKLKILGEAVAQEAKIAKIGAEAVYRVIQAYFGEGGLALKVFAAYLDAVKRLLNQIPKGFSKDIDVTTPGSPPGFASGGAGVFKQTTTIQVGEVPELAMFVPLNQLDKLSALFDSVGSGRSGANGETKVRIALSPGLVGEIVDQSSAAAAEVIFENNRRW